MDQISKPLRTATYIMRLSPEEKAGLQAKVEHASAEGKLPLTLAHAMRVGAEAYLDDLLERIADEKARSGKRGPSV